MKISLCMIVKNEEKTIYRCLESMIGFVDEWIIGIDSKVSDNTPKEIQKFFLDNKNLKSDVYNYKWQDSFAKARNEGMDKATGDYILIIDGHEFFPSEWYNITEGAKIPVRKVLQHIRTHLKPEAADEVFFHLYQQPFYDEVPNNYFLQPRMYRNGFSTLKKYKDKKLRFNRAAHNCILYTDPEKIVYYPEVILIHDAPEENREERKKQRIEVNTKNLQEDLKKNSKDTRALFYYGNTLMEAEKYDEAIKYYKLYNKYRTDEVSEKYQVNLHKAICEKIINKINDSKKSLFECININPVRRDAIVVLADLYLESEKYDEAIYWYQCALMVKPKQSRMFNNGEVNTWMPYQQLSKAYEKIGNIPSAISYLKMALRYVKNQVWLDKIDKLQNKKKNVLIVDSIGSFTKGFYDYLKNKDYEIIQVKQMTNNLGLWADMIFCEWADQNAVHASQKFPNKTVIRIHGYEAYLNDQILAQINWNCKHIIYVAEHIRDMINTKLGIKLNNTSVIQNGVDIEKFFIKTKERDPKNIGYAGFINDKKNPYLLLKIIKDNPDYTFNLRIDHQSPFWKETFKYELKDCKNVIYHGRYDDLNEFWNQMSGVLSTSIIESFSFNIAEGMACGCRPYIYNWRGSDKIWNEKFIFNDMPKLTNGLDIKEMEEHRKYITENYKDSTKYEQMEAIL